MSVDRSTQARAISIQYAKDARRPLEIWPGDAGNIKLEDLPDVGSEWKVNPDGVNVFTAGEFASIADRLLTPGRKYGILSKEYVPGVGMEYMIGEWR